MTENSGIPALIDYNQIWMGERAKDLRSKLTGVHLEVAQQLPKLLIVCDDAHAMMRRFLPASLKLIDNRREVHADIHCLFRSALRVFKFYWAHSLCLAVTSEVWNEGDDFFVDRGDNPSFRAFTRIQRMHFPIVLQTLDVHCERQYLRKTVSDWMEFLFSMDRVMSIATSGRPIFGGLFKRFLEELPARQAFQILNEDYFKPFNLIDSSKLVRVLEGVCDDTPREGGNWISIFKHLAPLSVGACPPLRECESLIFKGVLAVSKLDPPEKKMTVLARSEGLLNGAATLILLDFFKDQTITAMCRNHIMVQGGVAVGAIPDLYYRVELLKAVHASGRGKMFAKLKEEVSESPKEPAEFIFEPVSLEEFMTAYAGQEAAVALFKRQASLTGSFIAFSHFIVDQDGQFEKCPYDALAEALSRGSAIALSQGACVIPLVLLDGTLSFVYLCTCLAQQEATDLDVAESSPLKMFGDALKQSTPICHIYHHYFNAKDHTFKVQSTFLQQPCLVLTGSRMWSIQLLNMVISMGMNC